LLKEAQIRALHHHLPDVKLGSMRSIYEQIVRELRAEGVELSDRRLVKGLKLIAGAALLAGRAEPVPAALWPLYRVWSRVADAPIFRKTIEPHVLGGGPAPSRARPAADLLADLGTLETRSKLLRGETAVGAHLGA